MFIGIHHVAIVVRSLEEALGFYRDTLGLSVGRQATVADQGVHAALLSLGEDEIELLQPANPAGSVARFLEKRGEGIHHLCIRTPDVGAALARAKGANLPLIDQAPRRGLAGTIGFLHPGASHGVLVELAQPDETPAPHLATEKGIGAVGIAAFCVGAKDPAAMADAFARNFDARLTGPEQDAYLPARKLVAEVGRSQVAIFDANEISASPEFSRALGGRVEGVFGLRLAVADFNTAVRHLGERKTPLEVRHDAGAVPLARVGAEHTHGVNLFLSPRA